MWRRASRRLVVVLASVVATAASLVAVAAASEASDLLPDLDPSLGKPRVTHAGGRLYLTFTARIANVGAGPLVLRGNRAVAGEPVMTVDQVLHLADGTERTVPAVSTFEYDSEYDRWGYTNYVRNVLRRSDGTMVSSGPAIGFCVVDWVNLPGTMPGEPESSRFTTCGNGKPRLMTLEEGISIGWANQHTWGRRGQRLEISKTTVPSGDYTLVHRVDPNGILTESDTTNNKASSVVRITWKPGRSTPIVRQLVSCPDSAICSF